jgi:uncharacterized protein YegL
VPSGQVIKPPKVGLVRLVAGLLIGSLMLVGGLGYGGSKGILPASFSKLTGNIFGAPQEPARSGDTPVADSPVRAVRGGNSLAGSTAFVLDISGSMESPASIPADFPKAKELKEKQDAFESLVEQLISGEKVPLGTVVAGASGATDLIKLQQELDAYLTAQNIDPESISKLTALKKATNSTLGTLAAEQKGLGLNSQAGAVTFSTNGRELAGLTSNIASIEPRVTALKTEGSTNIGEGLQKGLAMVDGKPSPVIILLSDGWNNTGMSNDQILSGPVAAAAQKKIPICAIGIGQSPADVDQRLLTQVASQTGGDYYFVGDRVSLGADMLLCHHSLAGERLVSYRGKVSQGETASVPAFTVPQGKAMLSVSLNWPGSELDLKLTDARGREVGNGAGTLTRQDGLVTAIVPNPAPGEWHATVTGKTVSSGQEDFFVVGSTDGTTATQHLDAVVGSASNTADTGPFASTRHVIRLVVVIAAIVAGISILLLTLRGLERRLRRRRLAKKGARLKGAWFIPTVLYLGAVVGVVVLLGAGVVNYLWETPLISLPKS